MDISITIVNYNTKQYLEKCIKSIYAQTKNISFEIIVVDNASTDGSIQMLKEKFSDVKIITNNKNLFFTKAHNQAFRISNGRYIVALNSDTIILDNTFDKMVEFMDKNSNPYFAVGFENRDVKVASFYTQKSPSIPAAVCKEFFGSKNKQILRRIPKATAKYGFNTGACGPKIFLQDMSLQRSSDRFPTFLYGLFDVLYINSFWKNNPVMKHHIYADWDRSSIKEVDTICGACMIVRKEVADKVGFFDENIVIYWEEVDWCKRIIEAGHKIYYVPEAQIIHYGSIAMDLIGRRKKQKIFYDSLCYYYKKHFGFSVFILFRLLSWLTIMLYELYLTTLRKYIKK